MRILHASAEYKPKKRERKMLQLIKEASSGNYWWQMLSGVGQCIEFSSSLSIKWKKQNNSILRGITGSRKEVPKGGSQKRLLCHWKCSNFIATSESKFSSFSAVVYEENRQEHLWRRQILKEENRLLEYKITQNLCNRCENQCARWKKKKKKQKNKIRTNRVLSMRQL